MKLIAIIPARGNSKRIPNKNLLQINNKKILKILFENLKKLKIFNKIILSSECEKVLILGKKIGFDVIKRPKRLSKDSTSTVDVVKESIRSIEKIINFSHVCCIYPFAILLKKKDFLKSFSLLRNNLDIVFPAIRYGHPIQRGFQIKKNHSIKYINTRLDKMKQTQLFRPHFYDAGQFYIGHKSAWKNYAKSKKKCFEIENLSAVDVDNISDFKLLKLLYLNKKKI